MRDEAKLRDLLERIHGRGYKAYEDLQGEWALGSFALHVDHVQADPFAAPSRMRLRVPGELARMPGSLQESRVARIALADCLAREVRRAIRATEHEGGGRSGSGKSGLVEIDAGGQACLERTAIRIDDAFVEARIEVGLPATGRRALGREAEQLLVGRLPRIAERSLLFEALDADEVAHFVHCIENQEAVRDQLREAGLVAFVGNGAILPRESGASDLPLPRDVAEPFHSPKSFEVEIPVPHANVGQPGGRWRGLGVEHGVTLIVGGGYHGKSTLLRALERAVHPHIPGDGRETVVADPTLVKIRAEDGRAVTGVDIHAFIDRLPGVDAAEPGRGHDPRAFSTRDASGSTSQAANIVEAIEAGTRGLLLDEDTSATNFMVRDARMQALVASDHEPITPFVDRVRELHDSLGISTVLVMGGSGDYFEAADRVIEMREFAARDVTAEAKRIAAARPSERQSEARAPLEALRPRRPGAEGLDPARGRRDVKITARGLDRIEFGRETIDLRGVEQLVDPSQTRAIGLALHLAARRFMSPPATLPELLDRLDGFIDEEGLDALEPRHRPGRHPGALARPRRFEIAAALNRLRSLGLTSGEPEGSA